MPARHLAARASNSEDSRRSQSVAAADHPGPELDKEAGGPGCCGRAVPCHCLCRPPPHALYAKRTQRTVCVVLLEDCSRCLCLQTTDSGLRLACRGTMRVPGCLPSWKGTSDAWVIGLHCWGFGNQDSCILVKGNKHFYES